jgi:hypothetical protein
MTVGVDAMQNEQLDEEEAGPGIDVGGEKRERARRRDMVGDRVREEERAEEKSISSHGSETKKEWDRNRREKERCGSQERTK